MQQAISDYKAGKFPSIRATATHHGVHFSTLSKRLKGMLPRHLAHPEQALLTAE